MMKKRTKLCGSCDEVTEQEFILGEVNHLGYLVVLFVSFVLSAVIGSAGMALFAVLTLITLTVWFASFSKSSREKSGYWSCNSCGDNAAFSLTKKEFEIMLKTYESLVSTSPLASEADRTRLEKLKSGKHVPISVIKQAIKDLN